MWIILHCLCAAAALAAQTTVPAPDLRLAALSEPHGGVPGAPPACVVLEIRLGRPIPKTPPNATNALPAAGSRDCAHVFLASAGRRRA